MPCFGVDSTCVKVHPDGTGARKTNGPQSTGKSRGGWNKKIHIVSASDRQAHDAPCWRAGPTRSGTRLWRWTAPTKGDETRQLVHDLGMTPVVPPKANRKAERDYDRETCKQRNEIEHLFRRFKGCRRLFTRFDKLDATFMGFVSLAAVVEMMHDLA